MAATAQRTSRPGRSARMARKTRPPRMPYSARWLAFRIKKWSTTKVSGETGWMALINFSSRGAVLPEEKDPVDAAKITAVHRNGGSHKRRVVRDGIGARV